MPGPREYNFAYAVVYSPDGDFIIANKNSKAYYYTSRLLDSSKQDGWDVKPLGQPIKPGGGMACFPGGGLSGKPEVEAAKMEFLEETGVDLNAYAPQVNSLKCTDGPYTYYGVYFSVAPADLTTIYNRVTVSLNNSLQLAAVIQQYKSPIVKPVDVAEYANAKNMDIYALDNELKNIQIWNCTDQNVINKISGWNNNAQNWFKPIFNFLRTLCHP